MNKSKVYPLLALLSLSLVGSPTKGKKPKQVSTPQTASSAKVEQVTIFEPVKITPVGYERGGKSFGSVFILKVKTESIAESKDFLTSAITKEMEKIGFVECEKDPEVFDRFSSPFYPLLTQTIKIFAPKSQEIFNKFANGIIFYNNRITGEISGSMNQLYIIFGYEAPSWLNGYTALRGQYKVLPSGDFIIGNHPTSKGATFSGESIIDSIKDNLKEGQLLDNNVIFSWGIRRKVSDYYSQN